MTETIIVQETDPGILNTLTLAFAGGRIHVICFIGLRRRFFGNDRTPNDKAEARLTAM
jgi:hypothetical protein